MAHGNNEDGVPGGNVSVAATAGSVAVLPPPDIEDPVPVEPEVIQHLWKLNAETAAIRANGESPVP